MNLCWKCEQPLTFTAGVGWTHPEGGLYMQKCRSCGHRAAVRPSPRSCPNCGSYDWRDDHIGGPVSAEARMGRGWPA